MGTPIRQWVEVRSIRQAAQETWWMVLHAPEIAAAAVPGQFLMVGLGLTQVGAPFLPRPFSVGWRDRATGSVGLLIREFGAGTRRLARLRHGDQLLLLGPLGRGFHIPAGRPIVCVGGGVGLAPFLIVVGRGRLRVAVLGALAVGIAFPVLELAGLEADGESATPFGLFTLAALYSLLPAAIKLGAVALVAGYPITATRLRRIRRLIEARAARTASG